MEGVLLVLGAVAFVMALRIILLYHSKKNAQRAAFYKEYTSVLNDPQYKPKNNYD